MKKCAECKASCHRWIPESQSRNESAIDSLHLQETDFWLNSRNFNPLDAGRRYTDYMQTSYAAGLRYTVQMARYPTRRQTVYLRYGA